MAEGIKITAQGGAGGSLFKLSGVIDESFSKSEFVASAKGVVVLDLNGVSRITSFGVREWVSALGQLSCDYYCFVRCRPAIVAQFNMVAHFAGRGQLLSFYAPYVCTGCGKDVDELVDLRGTKPDLAAYGSKSIPCPACGQAAEFDDVPESFFSYVARAPPPTVPPLVEAILDGSLFSAARPATVEKAVEGNVTVLSISGDLDRRSTFKRVADGLEGTVLILADEVKRFSPEGLAGFQNFLASTSASLFLGGFSYDTLRALAPAIWSKASVCSVRMPFQCSKCATPTMRDLDLTAEPRFKMADEHPDCCLSCGGGLRPTFSEELLQAAYEFRSIALPPELRTFLDRRKARSGSGSTPLTPSDVMPVTGASFGRYQLLKRLGVGGMGEVYLARQTSVGGFEKKVVVKTLLPHLAADSLFVKMFLQEARLVARISHPNVVQVFDVGETNGQYFMSMEYVRGRDLHAVLAISEKLNRPLPVSIAARIIADACLGLHAAHTATDGLGAPTPIMHRDISPHNILVSLDGQTKIADFGIAKARDNSSLTPTPTVKGKLSYMAPEQVQTPGSPVDARVDIFATGITLYQCLTRVQPLRRETEIATLNAILHQTIPRPSTYRPDVPPALEEIVARATSRDRNARYPSALAFREDLEKFLHDTQSERATSSGEVAEWLKSLLSDAQDAQISLAKNPLGQVTPTGNTVAAPTKVVDVSPVLLNTSHSGDE